MSIALINALHVALVIFSSFISHVILLGPIAASQWPEGCEIKKILSLLPHCVAVEVY